MTTILLQPHPDDLAYSLGGALIRKSFGPNIMVINIFSDSESSKIELKNVSSTRRKENERFFKKLGIKYIDLRLPDSSVRSLYSTWECFNIIRLELLKIIKHEDIVISPMAIGYHIDHVLVKEAANVFQDIMYYEDIPYVFRYGSKSKIKNMIKVSLGIQKVMEEKIENLKIYKSQMDDITLEQVRNKYEEVIWY